MFLAAGGTFIFETTSVRQRFLYERLLLNLGDVPIENISNYCLQLLVLKM